MSASRVPVAPIVVARRLLLTLPTAGLVAVLAHLIVFGTAHAPGAEHAATLLAALAAGLGVPLAAAFLGFEGPGRAPVAALARGRATLAVGIAATLIFGAIELCEGHAALPLATLLAVVPLAALALAGSRLARRIAFQAGSRLLTWSRNRGRRAAARFLRRANAALRFSTHPGRLACGERAPPSLA